MLHPLNPPSCINELNYLMDLQRELLVLGASISKYADAEFAACFDASICDWFFTKRDSGDKKDKQFVTLFQTFASYVKCDPVEKSEIISAFDNDRDFFVNLDDPEFIFELNSSKSQAYMLASNCLKPFYEFLGRSGYPPEIMAPVKEGGFCREDIINGFINSNPFIQYVCPSCDYVFSYIPDQTNPQGYTIEHQFPRSLYPAICLNPYNLIPMCYVCNQKKGSKDPLCPPCEPPFTIPYNEVLHSIKRPIRDNANLVFSTSTAVEIMQFEPTKEGITQNAIAGYSTLYAIPDRWQFDRIRVTNRADSNIRWALRVLSNNFKTEIDNEVLWQAVELAIEEMEGKFGYEQFNYPAASWLRWAVTHKRDYLESSYRPYLNK